MKFSKEPVAWLTLVAIVATIAKDVLTHNLDIGTAVNSLIVAFGGVIVRGSVTPIEKLTELIDPEFPSKDS